MRHLLSAFCDEKETNKGLLESQLKIFLQFVLSKVAQGKAELPHHLKKKYQRAEDIRVNKALKMKVSLEDYRGLNLLDSVPRCTEDIF